MDLPARIVVYCPALELKNKPARLIAVLPIGYYEVLLDFSDRNHTALLPISGTAIVFSEPNPPAETIPDLER